ncbi:tyrosine-type recombinase/integrase [Natronospira bacteriovora]|uniref:Tyrosine-type recombinase/integrase n=1 Tax=Natronospira bacteriovora TaxID=3069753 RepID=A0ABU0W5R8_9GAMM|nr:tyrosine-type recombinase/integrase [Natronospira sp. AB-CW4]MDQ2069284.1 tyrosine-type recombinase/integrase [Natronospira sp. AB-CW4]
MDKMIPFHARPVAQPGELTLLCRRYLQRLQRRGRAEETLRAYSCDLGQFVGWCQQRGLLTATAVGSRHIEDWLDALVTGEGMTLRTAARKLETVRGLYKYVCAQGLLEPHANPMHQVDPPRYHHEPVIAPPAREIERLIDAIDTRTPMGLRDRAMLMLLYDAALRCQGVVSLDLYRPDATRRCQVQPDGLIWYRAKGGRLEQGLCGEATLEAVNDWLAVRRHYTRSAVPTEALFINRTGKRIRRQTIYNRVKALGETHGLHGLHPHMLRHRRLGDLYDKLDARAAADVAGHTDPATTIRTYGSVSRQRLRERVQRECPVGVEQRRAG